MDWKNDALLILGFWSLYSLLVIYTWYYSEQSFSLGITLFMGVIFVVVYAGIRYFLLKSQSWKKETPQKEEDGKPQENSENTLPVLEAPLPINQEEVQDYDLN